MGEREREERMGGVAGVALVVVGGLISITAASSVAIKLLQEASEAKQVVIVISPLFFI